ncbi:MAG: sulfur reduction protein DsrE [Demequinaceae bacterium]|nr:sulfur reduction protein DsrE [Demequinaceae bacterium]
MTRLVIKCTWGVEREETLVQAFTVAATAAASGVDVSMWLTGEASLFALPGTEDVLLPHAAPLSTLRETLMAGGTLTLCTQCAQRRDIAPSDVIDGVRIAGAAAFLEESLAPDATVLVY